MIDAPAPETRRDPAERLFLEALDEAFAQAEGGGGTVCRLRLAGRLEIRLRVAGAPLAAALLPALAWVTAEPGPAPLEIRAFASQRLPPSPWQLEPRPRGEISGVSAGITAVFAGDVPALSVVDAFRARAWYWTPAPERLPAWELAAPLLRLLPSLLGSDSPTLAHAAAVGDGRRALLLVGRGGRGKSTSALAALGAGLELLGDDYILLETGGEPPRVAPLYASAKADGASLARLEAAGVRLALRTRDPSGKSVAELPRSARPAGNGVREVAAVVLPRIATGTGTPEPIAPGAALRALAPSSILQLPFAGATEFARFARVVRHVPAYELPVGPDLAQVGAALARLLAELPA